MKKTTAPLDSSIQTREWFSIASSNALAAVLLSKNIGLRTQSLYFVQQSMEATTKGIASSAGISHEEVRSSGHNNLQLFIKVLDEVVTRINGAAFINGIMSSQNSEQESYDVVKQLQDLLEVTAKPVDAKKLGAERERKAREFFSSMLLVSPEVVKALLETVKQLKKALTSQDINRVLVAPLTKAPFVINLPPLGVDILETVAQQVLEQCKERIGESNLSEENAALIHRFYPALVRTSIVFSAEQLRSEIEEHGGKFSFGKALPVRSLRLSLAFMELLIIGGLVWPHESYSRYAAPPHAPSRVEEIGGQMFLLGSRHYTDELGVIRYIRKLAKYAREAVTSFEDSYNAGHLLRAP